MRYFLLGIIFTFVILPILESLTSAICLRIDEYKAKRSVQINRYNIIIEQENNNMGTSTAHPIGFVNNEETEVEDDDYELL